MNMSEAPSANPETTNEKTNAPPPLVRHARCEAWGRGLMLWEREGKRGYQFEDGKLHVIAEGYFDLILPAKKPDPVLRHRLKEAAVANGFELADGTKKKGSANTPLPNLDDQITVFEGVYEGNFHGDAWIEAFRKRASGRRIKRHRDPAIEEAKEVLSKDALQACVDAGNYSEVLERVVKVVGKTDLATKQQLDVFKGVEADRELAEALIGFLHDVRQGELAVMARLRRALARFDIKTPAWTVLTAPRALLYPADHMCVRPSVIRAQCKSLMPRYKPGSVPSADDYSRCLELAMTVREYLTKEGFAPRDLFDVTDFMKVSLSSSVKDKLTEAMVLRRADAGKN
jgi:hypothetical protein